MAGGDDPTSQISQRQKDIIAATWNELKNAAKNPGLRRTMPNSWRSRKKSWRSRRNRWPSA